MPIVIRKFNETQTMGDALKGLRLAIPRTLSEMAAYTKMQKPMLEAFERNAFDRLPQPTYARQFLKTYVKALGGDEGYFLQRFEEERGTCDFMRGARLPPQRARAGSRLSLASVSRIAGLAAGALIAVGYLGFQVRAITAAPKLTLESPLDGYVSQSAIVHLSGEADPKATVQVNGTEVLAHPDGRFETDVALERGMNVIRIESAKRYSRTATVYRRIVLEQTARAAALGTIPASSEN